METTEELVKVVVPSHKRHDTATTPHLVDNCILCVEESQEALYRENFPDVEILAHPDDIKGYCPKAQWIREQLGDVFLLDDDLDKVMWAPSYPKTRSLNPQEIYEVIQWNAYIAKAKGSKIFGFGSFANPLAYSGHSFFRNSGFLIGGALGVFSDFDINYRDNPVESDGDYWLSGMNAYHYRFIHKDLRAIFSFNDTFVGTGGGALHRDTSMARKGLASLQALFGNDIIIAKKPSRHREMRHAYEKAMKVPF